MSDIVVCVDEEELIHLALEALPPEYDAFCSAIRTRNDVYSLEELNTLLNAEERSIKKKSNNKESTSLVMSMNHFNNNFNNRGRGKNSSNRDRGNGRGNGNAQFYGNFGPGSGGQAYGSFGNGQGSSFGPPSGSSSSEFQSKSGSQLSQNQRPTCQTCGKNGHTALDCYHRMNFAYQGRHAPAKLASMAVSSMAAAANSTQNSQQLTNTGASNHVTPDLAQLSLHQQPTVGNESITIGNEQELPVTHIGNGKLITPSHNFKLDVILCVPQLASNLHSVHKLCLQNNAFCYFDPYKFSI